MARLPFHHHLKNAFIPHAGNDYHPHAIRRPWLHVYGAALIAIKVFAVAFISLYAGVAHQTSITPSAIIHLTNNARRAQGVSSLTSNALLVKAAQSKASDMVSHNYFAHISPSKVTPWYWFQQAGYKYSYAGENLAIDFVSSEDVIQAWLASPDHRKNLLSSRYKEIGVAVTTGTINGVNSVLVVQMFGTAIKSASTVATTTTTPKQTPDPATTKNQLVAAAQPLVLGESSTAPTPMAKPIISSPASQSVVRTSRPTVVGTTEAGAQVQLLNGVTLVDSQTVGASGVFTLQPIADLPEGAQQLSVLASHRGLSAASETLTISVDTVVPELNEQESFALPSVTERGAYDVHIVTSNAVTKVQVIQGATTKDLFLTDGAYVGHVQPQVGGVDPGSLKVVLIDAAGNTTTVPFLDPTLMHPGVIPTGHGPASVELLALFFSRRVFVIVLILLALGLGLNLSMNWRRQHHPALAPLLLLIYVAGALALL